MPSRAHALPLVHPARPAGPAARPIAAPPDTDVTRGLDSAEAAARLEQYGRNEVPEEAPHRVLGFLKRFWGPSAWMIELVAAVSAVLRRPADVGLALGLLVANAILSEIQEGRAAAAVEALRARLRVRARVLRDGTWGPLPAAEVVPGDVLRVRAGDFLPADVRVVAGEVAVDQSALTGESLEVAAKPGSVLWSGSLVRRGEATAVAERTGADTYFGKTTRLVQGARHRLHVEEVIGRVVRWLFVITGVLTASALLAAVLRGLPVLELLPLLLLLLLSALPVALPAMFTVSMAVGATELSRQGVLVTRLSAAEDAATMDVLCVDKTGTITENRLAVVGVHAEPGTTEDEVVRIAAMASEEADQDPIDLAILAEARHRRLAPPDAARTAFRPFSAATRRTEAVFGEGSSAIRVVKGALATVAGECHLAPESARALEERVAAEAARGRRTLAVARASGGSDLRLAGLVVLEDPPRPDSRELISRLRDLGVRVAMLTGDALPVAREVARSVGLGSIEAVSRLREELRDGKESPGEALEDADGFAEVFPEDKFHVVKRLQDAGHVVGMTGDGVNDAPALRQAEVGIAVRASADVAKASASVVLTGDGLTGILALVRNGRVVYQRVLTWIVNKVSRTIQKSAFVTVAFLVTGRFVVSTLGMILLLFLTDFVKISLATDHMQGSPSPETWRIGGWVRVSVILGLLMLLENLGLLAVAWRAFGLGADLDALQTFSFQALLSFALFSIVSLRERRPFWRSRPSPVLAAALSGAALLGFLLPLADLPGLRRIPVTPSLLAFAFAAVATLLVNDVVKTRLVRAGNLVPSG
jgi:plasma-membrane proton-efflux P-type ATPase